MALLVLRLGLPALNGPLSEAALRNALVDMAPQLHVFGVSFLFVFVYWLLHHYQFRYLTGSSGNLAWLTGMLLASVAVIPFSTAVLGEYRVLTTAVVLYEGNLLAIQLMLLLTWRHAVKGGLMFGGDAPAGIVRRMRLALTLGVAYILVAMGLAFVAPRASLDVLFGLGLFYAILTWRGGYTLDAIRRRAVGDD